MIEAPWAKDSEGNAVPTYYKIDGNKVTQVIEFDEENFLPITADPNWVRLGKHWYNKVGNIATAIDVAMIAIGIGATYKTTSAVVSVLRAYRRNITRAVEKQIIKYIGKSAASWVGSSIAIALTIAGKSLGGIIAEGLDQGRKIRFLIWIILYYNPLIIGRICRNKTTILFSSGYCR